MAGIVHQPVPTMASPQMINLATLIGDAKCYELIRHPPPRNGGRATMIVALPSAVLIGQPVPDDAAQGQATTAVRLVSLGRAAALTSSRLATTRRLRMSTASDSVLHGWA
jgi:hypothetical protein